MFSASRTLGSRVHKKGNYSCKPRYFALDGTLARLIASLMENDSRPMIRSRKFLCKDPASSFRAKHFSSSPHATATPKRTIKRAPIREKKKNVASLQTKLSREQKRSVPIKRGETAKHFFTKFGSVKVLIDS